MARGSRIRSRRDPRIVIVGVGSVAYDVLTWHLDPDLRRLVWRISILPFVDDGQLTRVSTWVDPPAQTPEGAATDRWTECARAGSPVGGISRLLKSAEVVIVLGGLEPLTQDVLRTARRGSATVVLLCLARQSTRRRFLRHQRPALRSLRVLADTLVHLPIISPPTPVVDDYYQDPPVDVQAATCRLIARGIGGLCGPLLRSVDSRLVTLRTAAALLRRGRFAGLGIGVVPRKLGIKAAVGEALDGERKLPGGFPLGAAKNLWVCIEGGPGLKDDVADECRRAPEPLGLGDQTTVHFFVFGHDSPRRKLAVTLMALGFPRPSVSPTPLPSAWERAEDRARQLLSRLLPEQAERYREQGFIEVKSRLVEDQIYRIHNYHFPYSTEIVRSGRWTEDLCIGFKDSGLPPTDRVLAEYFLIRGDEGAYLRTANVDAPCLERAEHLEAERRRLQLAWDASHEMNRNKEEEGIV